MTDRCRASRTIGGADRNAPGEGSKKHRKSEPFSLAQIGNWHQIGTGTLAKHPLDGRGSTVVLTAEQMRVNAQGDDRGAMPEASADLHHVYACGDQRRGVAVAQAVETHSGN